MNCPMCLSVMYCNSEIHDLGFNKKRMDLHCNNKQCASREIVHSEHMGVITNDPYQWECDTYNFALKYDDVWYYLYGNGFTTNLITKKEEWIDGVGSLYISSIGGTGMLKAHYVNTWKYKDIIENNLMSVDFISISTDNDMHEKVWELFHKLRKYANVQ